MAKNWSIGKGWETAATQPKNPPTFYVQGEVAPGDTFKAFLETRARPDGEPGCLLLVKGGERALTLEQMDTLGHVLLTEVARQRKTPLVVIEE